MARPFKLESTQQRIVQLQAHSSESNAVREELRDYLARTGLVLADFARRIGYGTNTLRLFMIDRYYCVSGSDLRLRKAITDFIRLHPVEPQRHISGEPYETENMRTVRTAFQKLLRKPVMYVLYGPPGSQKTFSLQHEVARLNQQEMAKGGNRGAFLYEPRPGLRLRSLMRGVAEACGTRFDTDIDRILSNLRFEFGKRRIILVVDEAQRLDIECIEMLRMLVDRPPFFSLLFVGSHDLRVKFDAYSRSIEQINRRIIDTVKLPGLLHDEARGFVQRELASMLGQVSPEKADVMVERMIRDARRKDKYDANREYISIGALSYAIDEIKAAAEERQEAACE